MASENPVIVIVPGAWHVPEHYDVFVQLLREQTFEVVCVRNPTSNGDVPPTKSMKDNVTHLREVALSLVEQQGKEIVAILHSWGGVIGTDALHGLSVETRRQMNLKGGIRKLIYVAAVLPKLGESLADCDGGQLAPWVIFEVGTLFIPGKRLVVDDLIFQPETRGATLRVSEPENIFYSNTNSPEMRADAVSKLVPQPTGTFFVPVMHEAWRDTPSVFIVTTEDRAIPAFVLRMWVERVKAENGVHMQVEELESDHVPFLSMPNKLLEVISKVM